MINDSQTPRQGLKRHPSGGRQAGKRPPLLEHRIMLMALALVLAFGILTARMWYLQIVRGAYYTDMAEQNSLRPQWLKAPRGMIWGAGDRVLVDNRPSYDIYLVPREAGDEVEAVVWRLAQLLNLDGEALLQEVERNRRTPFTQIPVKFDVSKSDLTPVEEFSYMLPGVFTVVSPQRRYLYGRSAGQLLGYLGEIGPDELEQRRPRYKMGDVIGRAGLEQMYEHQLKGTDGHMYVTRYASGVPVLRTDPYGQLRISVDSLGHKLETFPRTEPVMGGDIHVTLDIEMQQKAEDLLRGRVGAIVVLNANTGEILAMASTPNYDPTVFVDSGADAERKRLLKARKPSPMVSLAYRENYPPGSVFKVMLAVAALEEGIIDEDTEFFCPGYYQLDGRGRKWNCWKKEGHGHMAVVDSLAYSCDVFFYNVGRNLGVDRIHQWAARMGLGVETGIDLPGEVTGLVPSREWKRQRMEKILPDQPWEHKWYDGETINLSIGQGATATTPLQNAVMMAAIANGGRLVRPYLNRELGPLVSEPFISPKTLDIVVRGMRKCVEKDTFPTGTGRRARVEGLTVLGKTGTAQVVALKHYEDYEDEEDIPYELRDHALFVAGVVDQDPPLAISVLIEHGLHGSTAAAPLAREIIDFFYPMGVRGLAVARGEAS